MIPSTESPDLDSIRDAHARIRDHIHRTPVLTCSSVNRSLNARCFFKCEMFQKTGSFKIRGATNKVLGLAKEELKNGVVTHSSGNHGAAVAMAASLRGVPAHVIMPEDSAKVKIEAVRHYGGSITFCRPLATDRTRVMDRIRQETGAILIHPFDDPDIISGQGTATVELLEEIPHLDLLVAPVGGGGLLSGAVVAATALRPGIRIFGAEPELADDTFRSFQAGKRIPLDKSDTIADGLRTSVGMRTFPILVDRVEGILLASEESIVSAMRCLWERMKIVAEPSAAVPLAGLLSARPTLEGQNVGVILTGGNLDLARLPFNR